MRAFVHAMIVAAISTAACGKSAPPSGREAVLDAWKRAGATVSAMAPTAPIGGGECRAGTAQGLDVTLCTYADAKAAEAAQGDGLALVADATGVSLAQGSMLLVVADRRKADPSGKAINQLTKVFRGRS